MTELQYIQKLAKTNRTRAVSGYSTEVFMKSNDGLSYEGQLTLPLLSVEHPVHLTNILRERFTILDGIINAPAYEQFTIPKKRGGNRSITAPLNKTKAVQNRLNKYLQAYYSLLRPAASYGFIRASQHDTTPPSIMGNALPHVGQPHIYSLDLKDYFTNITTKQVVRLFQSHLFDFNKPIAQALTLLVTFEGHLPTGAPTSPVIANLCTLQLDHALMAFATENELNYTRYADDMTFSSKSFIDTEMRLSIHHLIEAHGFHINPKKIHYRHPHQQHRVTGIIVNKKLNIDRKYLKNTCAMAHDLATNGLEQATLKHFKLAPSEVSTLHYQSFIDHLMGRINFICQVRGKDDPRVVRMYAQFEQHLHNLMT